MSSATPIYLLLIINPAFPQATALMKGKFMTLIMQSSAMKLPKKIETGQQLESFSSYNKHIVY